MGEPSRPRPTWPEQTIGERIVTAAWMAVAAHLAARDAAELSAGPDADDDLPASIADRLR